MAWSNGLSHWTDGKTAYISVAFSWRIKEACQIGQYYRDRGLTVRAGGDIFLIPQNAKLMQGVAEVGGDADALVHHNPLATIASRGCPVGCWFCIVTLANRYLKLDSSGFQLIPDFTPRPILCDNNLSALPVEYQDHIIRRYQETNTELIDANSGFEPMTFDEDCYHRWKKINRGAWRFAFDEMKEAEQVERMCKILKNESPRNKRVYVLIGNEPIAQCYQRVIKVRDWGCEPYAQAVLPLNAITRKSYKIIHDWDAMKLNDFQRWVDRFMWREGSVPLWEYQNRKNEPPLFTRSMVMA